ncbi:MAG: MaoC family dehydratase [Pseudomonadota bacterium]
MTSRAFEDFPAGAEFDLGTHRVGKDEIIAFAREFDPQPFHLDEEAGRNSLLGGLAASGWYTCSLLMRMTYDALLHNTRSLGSPGVDRLKWVRPVLAGDTVRARVHIVSARVSRSRPDMGIALCRFEMHNQNEELVLIQETSLLVERRGSA